jgi:hypothetical protein
MTQPSGMIVTDGRVLLGSEIEDEHKLNVIPRRIRVEQQTLSSDERINVVRSLTREALARGRPTEVLPPQREDFLTMYQRLAEQQRHVVSVHYLDAFDGASREARICRQLMQPIQQIDVYEAKTLEGGLEFLLKTAGALAEEGASATQLLALLRYLEGHMFTLLITPGTIKAQPWAEVTGRQRLRSALPGSETLWHFDPKQGKLVVMEQGKQIHANLGRLLHAQYGSLRYDTLVRYRGWTQQQLDAVTESFRAAGSAEAPRLEPVAATFLPCFPPTFLEILLLPTAADLARLRGLVQDPIWWKGAV